MSRSDEDPEEDEPVETGLPIMLLTARQVANLCQVSLDTVYAWTYERDFPVVMGQRQVRIHARLLDEWLVKRAEQGRLRKESAA